MINQGDIYWVEPSAEADTSLGNHPHPYVVVQDNLFNHSRIKTVIVCALSTNTRYANSYGNVLLTVGEANLPRQSAVIVSKISTIQKSQLGEYIGTLSDERIRQILAGLRLLQSSFMRAH